MFFSFFRLTFQKKISNFVAVTYILNYKSYAMLSILIPTFEYDCSDLVTSLHIQCEKLAQNQQLNYEIIVADDGSTNPVWQTVQKNTEALSHCKFVRQEHNIGRSRIRNFLTRIAQGDMLLFMDQDGIVINDFFIQRFVDAGQTHDVVCGNMVQSEQTPERRFHLRYFYEKRYESAFLKEIDTHPTGWPFRSFCFMISRRVADIVMMDERFSQYGYEDVKYGMDLEKHGFQIYHINNPLQNNELEDNETFVEKAETALQTLYRFREELADGVTLLQKIRQLQQRRVLPLIKGIGTPFMSLIRKNLCSDRPCLRLFNLYKLLYYLELNHG